MQSRKIGIEARSEDAGSAGVTTPAMVKEASKRIAITLSLAARVGAGCVSETSLDMGGDL